MIKRSSTSNRQQLQRDQALSTSSAEVNCLHRQLQSHKLYGIYSF